MGFFGQHSFDILLYEGADATGDYLGTYHVSGVNISDKFFDANGVVHLSNFGLTLDDLVRRHLTDNGQISKKYTIRVTNGKSGSDYVEFKPAYLTFEINDSL